MHETDFSTHDAIRHQIAARRWREECRGISINNVRIKADRESQSLITSAALACTIDPNYVAHWKSLDGFVELDTETIIAAATAVRIHVQACFDREAELLALLEAGEYTDELLGTGWP